jgi:uncharacterized protein
MQKYNRLLNILRGLESAVIAYSGGVDSTLLAKAAKDSGIRTLAVTGSSPTTPPHDLDDAVTMASEIGIPHRIIKTTEMKRPEFRKNTRDRCFFCKDTLFNELKKIASHEGYQTVIEGSNIDDLQDYRPGIKARDLHGVLSPLIDAGMTKTEIRMISKHLGLKTWEKPSSPCLSSRFPYGTPIDEKSLEMVNRAESFLRSKGFKDFRVRCQSEQARIEVPQEQLGVFIDPGFRKELTAFFMEIGFKYITLDLEGFKSGKLNR